MDNNWLCIDGILRDEIKISHLKNKRYKFNPCIKEYIRDLYKDLKELEKRYCTIFNINIIKEDDILDEEVDVIQAKIVIIITLSMNVLNGNYDKILQEINQMRALKYMKGVLNPCYKHKRIFIAGHEIQIYDDIKSEVVNDD